MLDRHQHRAAPFAADADPLEDTEHQKQDRRPDSDGGVGWKNADQEGSQTHDEQREDKDGLAADAVPIVTEDDPADRAGYEADEESRIGQQGAGDRIEVREKQLVQYQWRHDAIQKEIIPLDGRTDRACERDCAG